MYSTCTICIFSNMYLFRMYYLWICIFLNMYTFWIWIFYSFKNGFYLNIYILFEYVSFWLCVLSWPLRCIIASVYGEWLFIQYKIAINTVSYWGGARAPHVLWFWYSRRDPVVAGPNLPHFIPKLLVIWMDSMWRGVQVCDKKTGINKRQMLLISAKKACWK